MPTYRVTHGSVCIHGRTYRGDRRKPGEGDVLCLTEAEAQPLGASVELVSDEGQPDTPTQPTPTFVPFRGKRGKKR